MTKPLSWLSFAIGAVIVVWMGTAFMGANLLAFIITAAIAGGYVLGFSELLRYQKDSHSLHATVVNTSAPVETLGTWLNQLAPNLQLPVEQRIIEERSVIPTPVLTPYLVGLLVMLGLIGTFIGMVDTLKGAVIALESNSELEAVRSGLAAPIKGLGMAFGTSVAGVSASAALGLISTLSKRDRLNAWRELESIIGSHFGRFSIASERQRTFIAIQEQAQQWPNLVDRLGQLGDHLETMGKNVCDTLTKQQQQSLADTAHTVTEMTTKLQSSMQQELTATTTQMGAMVEPILERVLSHGQEQLQTAQNQWHQTNSDQLQVQIAAIKESTGDLQGYWQSGIEAQKTAQQDLIQKQQSWSDNIHQQISDSVSQTQQTIGHSLDNWLTQQNKAQQEHQTALATANEKIIADVLSQQEKQNTWNESITQQIEHSINQTQLSIGATLETWLTQQNKTQQEHLATLATANEKIIADAISQQEKQSVWNESITQKIEHSIDQTQTSIAQTLSSWLQEENTQEQARRETFANTNQRIFDEILAQQQQQNQRLNQQNESVESMQQQLQEHLISTQNKLGETLSRWLEQQSNTDQARLDAINTGNQNQFDELLNKHRQHAAALTKQQQTLTDSVAAIISDAESLLTARQRQQEQWQEQQQHLTQSFFELTEQELTQLRDKEIQRSLAAQTAFDDLQKSMSEQLGQLTQAVQTPMGELMATAAESPKVAAQVLSQLRTEMSSALERDNQILQERQTIMTQLDELATSVAGATTEQRDVIIEMAEACSKTLSEVSERFSAKVDSDIDKLTDGIDNATASSIEMTTLAETFASAVQDYQTANSQLLDHFGSLEAQITAMNDRSDEQMGYYVAQAREIIDHSLSSQQEMIEQLRRLGRETTSAG